MQGFFSLLSTYKRPSYENEIYLFILSAYSSKYIDLQKSFIRTIPIRFSVDEFM